MSDYKTLIGKSIKYLSSDPTDAGAEGQVWYNSTEGAFKTVLAVGSWSSGGNMGSTRYDIGSAGNLTANLAFGGYNGGAISSTESYDGSAWSAETSLPAGVYYHGGTGTQTAALKTGGDPSDATLEYDGASWSPGGSLNTSRDNFGMCGLQTAALAFGGTPPNWISATESYNGSTWTTLPGTLNTARQNQQVSGIGVQTAALSAGGFNGSSIGATESWDGSSWTTVASLPVGLSRHMGSGTQTAALLAGNNPASSSFDWDGTAWSLQTGLTTARNSAAGANTGTQTSAIVGGGTGPFPSVYSATEEYSFSIYSPIAATWASGGNTNNTSQSRAGFGSQTLAIAGPGVGPGGAIATTEIYDGSTWTNGNSSTRTPSDKNRYVSGAGTPTAGLIALGGYPAPNATTETEEWDGTSWTASNPASVARRGPVLGGIQTQALAVAGYSDATATYQNSTEEYDGTSWTTGGNLNTARGNHAGSSKGSQTAFMVTSGNTPALTTNTEEYNGTSWTEVNNQPTAIAYQGYAGTQTDCLVWNGYTPAAVTTTLNYDGTNWSTNPASLALARLNYHNNAGTASAAIVFGGEGPAGNVATTEEFTGAYNVLDYKTLTSS